jgi:hypothetical protein
MMQFDLSMQISSRNISEEGTIYELFEEGYLMWFLNDGKLDKFDKRITPYVGPGTSSSVKTNDVLEKLLGFYNTIGIAVGEPKIHEYLKETGIFSPYPADAKTYSHNGKEIYVFSGTQPSLSKVQREFVEKHQTMFPWTTLPPDEGSMEWVLQMDNGTLGRDILAHPKLTYTSSGMLNGKYGQTVFAIDLKNGDLQKVESFRNIDHESIGGIARNRFYVASEGFFHALKDMATPSYP